MPLTIHAFPKDKRVWRIDWLSSVSYPDRESMYGQPSLQVHFSSAEDGVAKLLRATHSKFVSIGTLVLLRIGDLWQARDLIASPAYETETWEVDIGPSTTSTMKAGQSIDGEFVLPLQEHSGHEHATQSFCVKVDLPDGRTIVIPAHELIRFYFGSSSPLIERLFRPPLSKSSLFSDESIEERTGHLALAPGIPRRSAHDVARIAFDDVAWEAATVIGLSCAEQAARQQAQIFPRARFPFVGRTTLRAKGQWLSRGDVPQRTFLVFELLSCSHRFPYKELHYTVDPATEEARLKKKAASVSDEAGTAKSSKPKLKGLEQQDASTHHAGRSFWLRRKSQFPDLDRKRVYANVSLAAPESEDGGSAVSPVASVGAVGAQVAGGRIGAVTLNAGDEAKAPEFLQAVLEALASAEWDSALLTGGGSDGWTIDWPPADCEQDDDGSDDLERLQTSAFRLSRDQASLTLVVIAQTGGICLALLPSAPAELEKVLALAHQTANAALEEEPPHGAAPVDGDSQAVGSWLLHELAADTPQSVRTARF